MLHEPLWWLGPSRYTNVFDESKINRIRWIAMFWTEYNDTLKIKINKNKNSVQNIYSDASF